MKKLVGSFQRYKIFIKALLQHGIPKTVLYFGWAPGDDLLCTVVLRGLRNMGKTRIWMMSNHPDLFKNNADVDAVIPINPRLLQMLKRLGSNVIQPGYTEMTPDGERQIPPNKHIILKLCESAGVTGTVELKPIFALPDIITNNSYNTNRGIGKLKIVIQSSGSSAMFPLSTKDWYPERFQQTVESLCNEFEFVQVGASSDPVLIGAMDLRGKNSIAETAKLLQTAHLFVGQVGFLMHLARSVDCKSVIVYGGRETPQQSGYACNTNLYSDLECSPCWLWTPCKIGKLCMDKISSQEVVFAIREQLTTGKTVPETETHHI